MTRLFLILLCLPLLLLSSCEDDDDLIVDGPELEVPPTYDFVRGTQTTVSFNGQLTRLAMSQELGGAMTTLNTPEETLDAMFTNEGEPFAEADLNASSKSIRSKVAASRELFFTNASEQAEIRADFDNWLARRAVTLATAGNAPASRGVAGRLPDGSSIRYLSTDGLEYNQMTLKGLIGGFTYDQTANNYLSPLVLDEADNRATNDAEQTEDGKNYTTMEHKWDEAYGYVFGNEDVLLGKYVNRVEGDPDYAGIRQELLDAFLLGRAAIVAGDYGLRDAQADIITERLTDVLAIRAVYYLMIGADGLDSPTPDYGVVFHDLSEGMGFIYSLQFTGETDRPTAMQYLTDLGFGKEGFLWDVTPEELRATARTIAEAYDLDLDAAAN